MPQEYHNNFERPEVQHNISYLESIINRMASNSANCKNWLLAIIAAGAALQPTANAITDKVLFALIPTILFCILDSYYLGMEKCFRDIMSSFVNEARKSGNGYEALLYIFEKRTVCDDIFSVFKGFFSIATWPMYVVIVVVILLIHFRIIVL